MTAVYTPQPGTLAARAVAHFAQIDPAAELTNNVLADALMVDANTLTACLQAPMRHGLLDRVKLEGRIYWRRGKASAAPAAVDPEDEDGEGDQPIARLVPAAEVEPLIGLPRQSWCPPPNGSGSSLDELPPPSPPALKVKPLDWKAPRVPVFLGDAPAPVPSPAPAPAPDPADAAIDAETVQALTAALVPAADIAVVDFSVVDADFLEVGEAAARAVCDPVHIDLLPGDTDTPQKGAESAQAPATGGSGGATPNDGASTQDKPSEFRCALWSDGKLHIEVYPGNFILLTKDETRQLVNYLDWMAEVSE